MDQDPATGGTEQPSVSRAANRASARDRAEIITLAWPVIVDNILITMVRMMSLMMVGHLGVAAIGAVGLTNQLVMLGMTLFMALGVGATALVARFRGAGLRADACKVSWQATLVSLWLGALAAACGWALAEPMLRALGAGSDVITAGLVYFRLSFATLILTAPGITIASCLRGAGDTRTPLRVNLLANVVNIALLHWLINGGVGIPPLGLVGAALAMMGARLVALVLLVSAMLRTTGWLTFAGQIRLALDVGLMRRVARVGLPNALEQVTMRGGQLVFTRLVLSLGTTIYAAHQIGINVTSLSFMPAFGMGAAATTLIGQSLGRQDPQRAERLGLATTRMAMLMTGLVGLGFLAFAPQLVALYTTDTEVIAAGVDVLRILSVAQPAVGVWFALSGALRGAGDTKWPLYISFVSVWGIRLVLAYILALSLGLGLVGIWVAITLDHCSRGLIVYLRFRRGHWKRMTV